MQRFITAIFATALTVATASAGEIQIGSGTNGVNGLTSSYIGAGAPEYTEKSYSARLFASATGPTGSANTGSNGSTPSTFTDSANGITFAAINDGAGNNFWDACAISTTCTTPATITVPIGINDPVSVWTMLNNIWGTPNGQQTTVTFDFKDGGTTVAPLVVNLINAYNNGATGGQIASSTDCSGPSSNRCTTFAGALGSALAPSSTINGITVLTGSVYSFAYNSITGGPYSGSNGELYLDDQGFVFGSATDSLSGLYSQDYLVDIKVTEYSGGSGVSQTALSAVTVVTPEPSTVLLVLAGFGVLGASRLRRRAS